MISSILLLVIIIFGFQVLFGKAKVENFYKFLVFLIFAPVLAAVGWNHTLWFFYNLPLWAKVLLVLLLPFFVSAALRLMFPNAKWLHALQTVVFQALIYAITFPFRFLWRAGQFLFRRERHVQRLNSYRAVVGGKPPVQNERREVNTREKNF